MDKLKPVKTLKSFNPCCECGEKIVEIFLVEKAYHIKCGSDICKKKRNSFCIVALNVSYEEAKEGFRSTWNKCNHDPISEIKACEKEIKNNEKAIIRTKKLYGVSYPEFSTLRLSVSEYADHLDTCKRADTNLVSVGSVIKKLRGMVK